MKRASILYQLFYSLFESNADSSQKTTVLTSIPPQPLDTDNQEAWKRHWKACKQPWRTEPEIDIKRQEELKQHLAIVFDTEQGIYPFKSMKLSRADVEWLLALNENEESSTYRSSEYQRECKSLDLRGADLRQADLHGLPLICLCGGELSQGEMLSVSNEYRDMVGIRLEGADLSWTQFSRLLSGNPGVYCRLLFARAHDQSSIFTLWSFYLQHDFISRTWVFPSCQYSD